MNFTVCSHRPGFFDPIFRSRDGPACPCAPSGGHRDVNRVERRAATKAVHPRPSPVPNAQRAAPRSDDVQARDLRRRCGCRRLCAPRWASVGGGPPDRAVDLQVGEEPVAPEPPGLEGRHEERHHVLALHEQL